MSYAICSYKRMEHVDHGMIYLACLLQEQCGFVVCSLLYGAAMVSLTAGISTTEERDTTLTHVSVTI